MKFVSIFLMLSLLGAVNASAIPVVLGGAGDGDLTLSVQELAESTPSSFLFVKRLGRVSFSQGSICINCGDFSDNGTIGRDHVVKRLKNDFLVFLKNQLFESNIFPNNVKERIPLRATLISLKQESSIGAAAEYNSRMTSGANLTTEVSIRYELIENEQVVGAWNITTRARSNSLAASTRLIESIDGALKRNVRVFLLKIIADYSPVDSARANQLIAALQGEADNTRSVMGYLVYGVTKTATTTAGVIGEGVKLAAQNSDVIADNINSTSALMEKNNREYNAAVIESNRVLAVQAAERERVRAEQAEREADRRSDAINERAARADAQLAADTYRAAETQRVADAQRTAEARQQLSSEAGEDSSSQSDAGSANSDTGQVSENLYVYIVDGQYRGVGATESEGCDRARKGGPNKTDIKRIISTGTCTCTDGYSNFYGKLLECTIPFSAEISSTINPKSGSNATAQGMSK